MVENFETPYTDLNEGANPGHRFDSMLIFYGLYFNSDGN